MKRPVVPQKSHRKSPTNGRRVFNVLADPTQLPISEVVEIDIKRSTAIPQQVDFGLACFFTTNTTVISPSTRYKLYDDLAGVMADFNNTTAEYKMAAAFFDQNPSPSQLMFACVNTTGSETYPQAIAAAYAFKKFYMIGVVDTTISDSVVTAIAQYVQAQTMLFLFQSSEAGILTTGTTDIAATLSAAGYDRTHLDYVDTGSLNRQDAANMGMAIPQAVGTFNWMFKQLTGQVATSASETGIANGLGKFCNFYAVIGGVPMTMRGYTSGSTATYADQIQVQDWLKITLETEIYNLLVNTPKVPYDDTGVKLIESVVYGVLAIAQKNGLIEPGYTVTADSVADVPPDQRADRIAPTIYFTATLSGCINKVVVRGTLAI